MTANKTDLCLCSSVWVEKSLETNVREKKDSNFYRKQKYMKVLLLCTRCRELKSVFTVLCSDL